MGSLHAWNAAVHISASQIVAVADPDLDSANRLAARLSGPRIYRTAEELIADLDVEAVIIASPPASHAELIASCAEAGKHVFTEKPVAVGMEQAHLAATAARESGIHVQVGFNRRYDAAYVAARKAIARGDIGEPLLFRSITRDRVQPPASYTSSPGSPGMLVDTGVHDFDLARWLMDEEVTQVQTVATGAERGASAHTAASVNLVFRTGSIGNVETVWGVAYADDVRTEVVGSAGAVSIGSASRLPVRVMTATGLVEDGYQDHFDRFGDSYLNELQAFVDAVAGRATIESTVADGVLALQLALAARESAERGMVPVDVITPVGI
jgi:scyllo-inositol 2-dehydrogenase (NAD+)